MLVNADIYVKDVPGQLIRTLEPLSDLNANLIGVVHSREQMISGRIAVNMTFDIEQDNLKKLKAEWKNRDVIVVRIGSAVDLCNISFMIIGSISGVTVDGLITAAGEKVEIISKSISISSSFKGNNSCMISANVKTEEDLDILDRFFSDACKAEGYTYIRGVE